MNDAPFPPAEALDPLSHGPAIPSGMITATIDAWFPRAEVTRILERSGDPAYRARSLTIELVFFGLLRAVVCGWPSFAVLVSRIRAGLGGDFGPVSVTPSAFYQRLADLPHGAFLAVLRQLVSRMGPMPASVRAWVTQLAPFATGVYAIDDTTLDALARKIASKSPAFLRPVATQRSATMKSTITANMRPGPLFFPEPVSASGAGAGAGTGAFGSATPPAGCSPPTRTTRSWRRRPPRPASRRPSD